MPWPALVLLTTLLEGLDIVGEALVAAAARQDSDLIVVPASPRTRFALAARGHERSSTPAQ